MTDQCETRMPLIGEKAPADRVESAQSSDYYCLDWFLCLKTDPETARAKR